MCTGVENLMMGGGGGAGGLAGTALQVGGQLMAGKAAGDEGRMRRDMAYQDAAWEEDERKQEAEKILRAARRERGAARAATAASGTRIDEFSLAAETEIDSLAGEDAAMTILTGRRRADSMRMAGDMAYKAGKNEQKASLFRAASTAYSGWKGTKGPGG